MDLKNLIEKGFSTARLTAGGNEQAQDPRWLGAKAQGVLLNHLRTLAIQCESIDANEDLSEAGRAKRRAELGTTALKEIEGDLAAIRSTLSAKLATAKQRLSEAGRPEGQSDVDRIARLLELQGVRQLLLTLNDQSLLGELVRSVKEGDQTTYEAIAGLPEIMLRSRNIAKETVTAARKQMLSRIDPSAVSMAEDSEVMSRLVDENFAEAKRAVVEHCGLPEERQTRFL